MARTILLLALLSLAGACRSAAVAVPSPVEAEAIAALRAIPRTLAQEGPLGWLRHFDPGAGFRMASDGALKFDGFAQARAAMEAFDPTIASMELVWSDLRVDALAGDLASFGAGYDELLVDTSGVETRFSGYVTGLLRRTGAGWRITSLHWSLPVH